MPGKIRSLPYFAMADQRTPGRVQPIPHTLPQLSIIGTPSIRRFHTISNFEKNEKLFFISPRGFCISGLTACDDFIHPTLQTGRNLCMCRCVYQQQVDTHQVSLLISPTYFEQQLPSRVFPEAVVTITITRAIIFILFGRHENKVSYFWFPSGAYLVKRGIHYTLSMTVNGKTV